jgi:NADH-quinone oxidoreductase subunit M
MLPFIGLMLLLLAIGLAAVIMLPERRSKIIGAAFSAAVAAIVVYVLVLSLSSGSLPVAEQYPSYIPQLGVSLTLQFTPIGFALTLMAAIVAFVTIFSGNMEKSNEKTATALLLVFELSAIGLFCSANLFIFFIFWDIGVVALFFMIYLLGSANRRKAAIKFLTYEIFASLLLFLAIMLIYFYTPVHSFDISQIATSSALISPNMQIAIFLLLFVAFLVNMPVFPLHLWLPDAHTEASTQGSMVLSGVLTKFGGYGMILAFSMLPTISLQYSPFIVALATVSAIYIAFVLMKQHDIKRIVAYTTIVEMSIILVGIAASNTYGTYGAAYAMLAHGFVIALLFLVAGSLKYMFHERDIRALKGAVAGSASTAYAFLLGVFATTGVPLTATFVGDILIFLGAVQAFSIYGAVSLSAIVLLGAFLYYVVNKAILSTKEKTVAEDFIGLSQKAGFAILLICIFVFGVAPFIILGFFK